MRGNQQDGPSSFHKQRQRLNATDCLPACTLLLLLFALVHASEPQRLFGDDTNKPFQPEVLPTESDVPSQSPKLLDGEMQIDDIDLGHWAYQPITRSEPTEVGSSDWPKTVIDRYILAKLQENSLSPVAEADRITLMRRLCFDLTGLPPTSAELSAYLQDQKPGSYRRLVERLLASPDYGRRWGQHWLDLARFAETDGYEHDKIRANAWRYRDWVVDALNQDVAYDQFITLQLAGDVLFPSETGLTPARIATAFLLSGPDMPDINSQLERRHVLLNEITATLGSTLLSLQIGCAQCHDHKYDPISQGDFYRLRAFFDRSIKLKTNQSVSVLSPNADADAVSQLHPRGDWQNAGPEVVAAFPRIANASGTQIAAGVHPRVQLANWLTSQAQALTARSIANRIWQHHFGKGLSRTPSDFGVMGDEPSHPELLDYLASRLLNHEWSIKDLHRQIVLSATYQTQSKRSFSAVPDKVASQAWSDAKKSDPENHLLAYFPRRRLDAESIRDAMLVASNAMNHQSGGPGISPPLPEALVKTLKNGQWKTSRNAADHHRRSIYIFARRNLRYPLFATFDRPAANCSCATRVSSTTAIQSLQLLNSKLTLDLSKQLANLCMSQHPGDSEAQVAEIFQRVLSRAPNHQDEIDCVSFLSSQTALVKQQGSQQPELDALTDLCRAMFNSNEFLYVD